MGAVPNKGTLEEKFNLYSDLLFKLAMIYLGNRLDAQDAVQETFLKYITKAPNFTNIQHEKAWLIRVVINICKDVLRSSWRKTVPISQVNQIGVYFSTKEDSEIMTEILSLPQKYNALFHQQPLTDVLRPRTKRLIEMGLVEHVGRNKFVLARSLYEVAGKSGVYTRLVGLDRDMNKERLLSHIRKNGKKGTPFKEFEQVLPSHSRNQIKVLVRELHQADLIYVVGKTSAARWFAR